MEKGFHDELSVYIKTRDLQNANHLIMRELAKSLIRDKSEFVDLLVYSGIPADVNMSDIELVDRYINNVDKNEKLIVGSAFLVNKNNQTVAFDGESEISDANVKHTVLILNSYFDGTPPPEIDPNEDFYSTSESFNQHVEQYENFGDGGGLGAIADMVKTVGGVAGTTIEGIRKKKSGGLDLATKKQDAKQQMISQIMDKRKAELEAKTEKSKTVSKTTKTLLIVGGSIVGLVVIGLVIYAIKKKK